MLLSFGNDQFVNVRPEMADRYIASGWSVVGDSPVAVKPDPEPVADAPAVPVKRPARRGQQKAGATGGVDDTK